MAGPTPPRTPNGEARALLAALEKELLAKLPRAAIGVLLGPIVATLEATTPPPSAAQLTRALDRLEDVMDALYLAGPRTGDP